jgi:hypothetical protein
MAWLLNIVLYNLFRFEKATQNFISYPLIMILRNRKVKESYRKRGVVDPEKVVFKALDDPEFGVSSTLSGAHYMSLFFLLTYGIVNFVLGLLRSGIDLELPYFVLMAILSYGFPHWYSFRQNRYLKYFKDFEKLPKNKNYVQLG